MTTSPSRYGILALSISFALAGPVSAQTTGAAGGDDAAALAKQLANPIASLISVPFQYNYNDGYGPQDGHQSYVNIQPVVPFSLNADWNVIVRTIVPVVWQTDVVPGTGSQSGLGNVTQSLFFSPKQPGPGGLIWGAGPVFLWPTATEDELGPDKWGAGPTVVALKQEGPWTVGFLGNHIWSYAGDDDEADVNSTFLQPFVNYTTKTATSFVLNTESTYDWESREWSVPINADVFQLLKIGGQRVQVGGGVRYWLTAPDSGPDGWGARFQVTLLFPK
jgi:hypothetical protein